MSGMTVMERLLLPLVRRFVSFWVRPSILPDSLAERFARGRPVVYALEKRSIIDLAVLEYVCREKALPMPLAPVVPQPADGALSVSVLFLERRAGFLRMRMHLDHLFYGGGVSWVDLQGTARFGDRRSPFAGLRMFCVESRSTCASHARGTATGGASPAS